jgi:4'-phosphopantetheinyl transferase
MNIFGPDPLDQPPLQQGLVQVWQIDFSKREKSFDEKTGIWFDCWSVLDAHERTRAERMRAGIARNEFIVARGYLRRLVGNILKCNPQEITFIKGENGKLSLKSCPDVHFNLTHSGAKILITLSRDGEVGIDLEAEKLDIEAMDVAQACFHPKEMALLRGQTSEQELAHAFYLCWTRKEAVAKADGRGLSLAPESFSVAPLQAGESEVRIGTSGEVTSIWVREIDAGSGYSAAFAACKPGIQMKCFDAMDLRYVA